jgi:Carboxypeptidase regulatory-like domain
MRSLLVFLVALLPLACASYPSPGQGTVTGTVVVSPCRPVERPGDPPCPPRPGLTVSFQPVGGGGPFSTTTDASGTYREQLVAGDYLVSASGGIAPSRPTRVTVTAGATVTLNLSVDSGIR